MGLVISGAVWHVTWQHFRGDLWLLLQLTYTSPFPARTLHLKLVCQMPNGARGFISGGAARRIFDFGEVPQSGFTFDHNIKRNTKAVFK